MKHETLPKYQAALLLLIANAVLGLLLFAEWQIGRMHSSQFEQSLNTKPSPKEMFAALPEALNTLEDADNYQDIVAHPLFIEGREPVDNSAEAAPGEEKADKPPEELTLSLSGIVMTPGNILALLHDKSGKSFHAQKGDTVQGWTVDAIESDKITLSNAAGVQQKLLLRDFSDKNPKRAPAPAQDATATPRPAKGAPPPRPNNRLPPHPCRRNQRLAMSRKAPPKKRILNQSRTLNPTRKIELMKRYALFLACLGLLSACHLLGPEGYQKKPVDDASLTPLPKIDAQLSKKTVAPKKPNSELFLGNGTFVAPLSGDERRYVESRDGKYTLNFESADIAEVIKVILGETLKRNYTLNPKVAGKVSLQTSRPLAEAELLPTLELLLQANNAVLLPDGDIYRVEPADDAAGSGVAAKLAFPGKTLPLGFQVRVFPLRYVSVKEMQEILKPMLGAKTLLHADTVRNMLVLAGNETELQSIQETIAIFDVNYMQGMSFGIFPLANVDAATADKELAEIFGYASGGNMEAMFKTIPIERLNAVLVITPQAKYLEQVKMWVSRLDRADTANAGGVSVYRVQNVKAIDLAATLGDIFMLGGGQASTKPPSVAAGRSGKQLGNKGGLGNNNRQGQQNPNQTQAQAQNTASSPTGAPSGTAQANNPGARGAGGGKVGNMGDVRIIPDEGNNSLIIVANAQDNEIIRNVIRQLDVMPLQVHIDASILGVELSDDLQYGVEWSFNSATNGYSGVGTIGDLLGSAAAAASTGGFSYIISHGSDVKAVLHALEDKNKLTVLSSPSLMVLNNQEASIQVGDQIPVRTSQSSPTNTTTDNVNNIIQTSGIEMKDTGVVLTVTPRVNASGMVLMDIEQDVDTAKQTTTSGIDSPTILKRSITSSVAIASGETVVLGGLISEDDTDNKSGVPWLMDIPVVGDLFSTTQRTKKRSELIVLITPRLVGDIETARSVTAEYKRKMGELYTDLPPGQTPPP